MAERFKCTECGRTFKTKGGLRQHTNDKHPNKKIQATERRRARSKFKLTKNWMILVSIVSIIVIAGSLIVFLGNPFNLAEVGQPVPENFYFNMTSLGDSTLNSIGQGTSEKLTPALSGDILMADGKPLAIYIGAEYCPYCAAERWSLILALSKFGNFSGLIFMLSSPSEGPQLSNIPTFSFINSNFTSPYISFQSVEIQDRFGRKLQTMTSQQASIFSNFNLPGNIPFVDVGNQYTLVGAQYSPTILSSLTWNQIAEQMKDPNSTVAKGIDGSSNILVSAICRITNQTPSTVCNQSYAKLNPVQ